MGVGVLSARAPEPRRAGAADAPAILQGKQRFEPFDARRSLSGSLDNVPVIERDKSERCGGQNKAERSR